MNDPDLILRLVEELPSREKLAVSLLYGLEGDPLSIKDAAKELKVSAERLREIRARAVGYLKDASGDKFLNDYDIRRLIVVGLMRRKAGIASDHRSSVAKTCD